MIKALGAALVALAALMWGVSAYRGLDERVRGIKSLIDALAVLRSEIVHRLAPLDEAATAVGKACNTPFAHRLAELARKRSFNDAFTVASELLRADERAAVAPLAAMLGRYSETEQSQALDRSIERLERLLHEAEEERNRSGKVYITLGICGGMAVCIVLL